MIDTLFSTKFQRTEKYAQWFILKYHVINGNKYLIHVGMVKYQSKICDIVWFYVVYLGFKYLILVENVNIKQKRVK